MHKCLSAILGQTYLPSKKHEVIFLKSHYQRFFQKKEVYKIIVLLGFYLVGGTPHTGHSGS